MTHDFKPNDWVVIKNDPAQTALVIDHVYG